MRRGAAIHFEDRTWTHAEFLAESVRWANLFLAHGPSTPDGVLHVGVLLDNTPEYLFALGGAALSGAVVVGLNHTRRDEHLLRDIEHTHVGLIVTEARHRDLLGPFESRLPTRAGRRRSRATRWPAPPTTTPASSPTSARDGR